MWLLMFYSSVSFLSCCNKNNLWFEDTLIFETVKFIRQNIKYPFLKCVTRYLLNHYEIFMYVQFNFMSIKQVINSFLIFDSITSGIFYYFISPTWPVYEFFKELINSQSLVIQNQVKYDINKKYSITNEKPCVHILNKSFVLLFQKAIWLDNLYKFPP